MKKLEFTIAQTLISNTIIILSLIYITSSTLLIYHAENWQGPFIQLLLLAVVFIGIWRIKVKHDCRLVLTDASFKVSYFNPAIKNLSYDLKKITSNIKVERFYLGYSMGSFPRLRDYINYRWYYRSEKFIISFTYDNGEEVKITCQPNVIGLEKLMQKVVERCNLQIENTKPEESITKVMLKSAIILVAVNSD